MRVENVKYTRASSAKIALDDGSVIEISVDDALAMQIRQGDELSGDRLESLLQTGKDFFAYKRAAASVAAGEASEKGLLRKLLQKGADLQSAQKAVEKLAKMGFVDDAAYAERLCENYGIVRHYGKRRVMQELAAHGIDRETAAQTAEAILLPDGENIALYFAEKLKNADLSDEKERRRTANALVRAGYSYETVNAFLRLAEE